MNLFSNFKKIAKSRFINFALIIFPIGCSGQVEPPGGPIIQDVPDGFGKGTVMESVHLVGDSLQLVRLNQGFDSIQIRFWFRYADRLDQQLILISYTKKDWSAIYCAFTPILDDQGNLVAFRKQFKNLLPRTSFRIIVDSLDHLGIWHIRDRSKMVDYPDVHGTDQVSIEISSMKMYRIIQHSYLEEVSKELPDVERIRRMVQLLISEFNVKLIRSM